MGLGDVLENEEVDVNGEMELNVCKRTLGDRVLTMRIG